MLKYLLFLFLLCKTSFQTSLQGFDDSILYSINWVNPNDDVAAADEQKKPSETINYEEIVVKTDSKEEYKCRIPLVIEGAKDTNEKYAGPNVLELLSELFTQTSCSYRLEAYWTYELCHGRYIRQYHEEREGKTVKLQEYFLGRWDKHDSETLQKILKDEESSAAQSPVPLKKIDGLNMPYFQINMTDGTLCDLNSKPRMTKVLYICYAMGKHEIYSLKETSICEYEVIVLSPILCSHPKYRPQTSGENAINCSPLGNAARIPKSLQQLEAESLKLLQQNFGSDKALSDLLARLHVDNDFDKHIPRVRLELLPLEHGVTEDLEQTSPANSPEATPGIDMVALNNFIDGTDCIQGGSGWWKYELCFGKSVTQFHVEKDGTKTVVNLGKFIKSGHLKWLKANQHKRPVPGSHVSYLYTMGSLCVETGLPRQTEVKLKCVENKNNPGAVSLYLLEPRTCQYILGVESRLICKLLENIDEDGLLTTSDRIGFTKSDYSSGYTRPNGAVGPDDRGKAKEIKVTIVLPEDGNHIADGDE